MAIQKITTPIIGDAAVTTDKINNNFVTSVTTNPEFQGTSHIKLPAGTTAQRPVSPAEGMMRYNTTLSSIEHYSSGSWASITAPPIVNSVSPTTELGSDDPQQLVISGFNFDGQCTVTIVGDDFTEYTPTTIVVNNSTQITITFAGGDVLDGTNEPYDVRVTSGTGIAVTLLNAFNINDVPTWTTAPGSLATVIEDEAMTPVTVSATDPESVGITYSLVSGALPTGISLNTSTGVISGTPNVNDSIVLSGVTYNFSIGASDGAQTTNRAFSILKKWRDGTTQDLAVPSGSHLVNTLGITEDGVFWLQPPGGSGTAFQAYVLNSIHGGGWVKFLQYHNATNMNTTSAINQNGAWAQTAKNLNAGKLSNTDIHALQANGTNTQFLFTVDKGSNGKYRYWRYIEGSTVISHHPRVSRFIFEEPSGTQHNAKVYNSDNCTDTGEYQPGSWDYDHGSAIFVSNLKFYTVSTAERSAAFQLLGSNDGSTFEVVMSGQAYAPGGSCGIYSASNVDWNATPGIGIKADPLLNHGYGIGAFATTSGILTTWGTGTDPTTTYDMKVDKTMNGSWDLVVRYSNDTRAVCSHSPAGAKLWYNDHNYNATVQSGSYPQSVNGSMCFSFGQYSLGSNLHFLSGVDSGQADGDQHYGYESITSCGLWIK